MNQISVFMSLYIWRGVVKVKKDPKFNKTLNWLKIKCEYGTH